jgi:hypothetical protein
MWCRAFSKCRTTTGSEMTMKALGPKASLNTGPCSMNLQHDHACAGCRMLPGAAVQMPNGAERAIAQWSGAQLCMQSCN